VTCPKIIFQNLLEGPKEVHLNLDKRDKSPGQDLILGIPSTNQEC